MEQPIKETQKMILQILRSIKFKYDIDIMDVYSGIMDESKCLSDADFECKYNISKEYYRGYTDSISTAVENIESMLRDANY